MNPGYPGRAELPESLKALFRPVSMVLPDLALICEIMLMAEGFQMSKLLSRKFVILYKLCEDLLSKARHYDWKLRAIKTTLYVAGGMKRDAPELTEDKVLAYLLVFALFWLRSHLLLKKFGQSYPDTWTAGFRCYCERCETLT
jgi:dynein heavy chain, axonemal